MDERPRNVLTVPELRLWWLHEVADEELGLQRLRAAAKCFIGMMEMQPRWRALWAT
jgi:hypothetical protein